MIYLNMQSGKPGRVHRAGNSAEDWLRDELGFSSLIDAGLIVTEVTAERVTGLDTITTVINAVGMKARTARLRDELHALLGQKHG